jgi:acyl-coenzyme A synthetase/AMP-(fatty) acid ligase
VVTALRERVEPAFLPRPVVMAPALPRDAVGKLRREDLARLAWPR